MTVLDAARIVLASALDPQARLERRAARLLRRAQRTVLDALAPDLTEETPDGYRVGGRWTRALVVDGTPAAVEPGWDGWLASLLRLDGGGAHGAGEIRLALTVRPHSTGGAA